MKSPVYALGHSDRELERLSAQERLIGPATRQFFREAEIGTGMRVLDVGSGAGDSTFLVAELVGEAGEVIGTDKDTAVVAAATRRAKAGTDTNMAGKLHRAFVGAGLPAPQMRMQTFIGGGAGCTDWLQAVADLVGILLTRMEQLGVATAAEVEVTTLAERLLREVTVNDSVIIGRSEIGAWSRTDQPS